MKELLNAIKSKLKTDLTYLRNVEIIPSEEFPPDEAGFPCVGLKDGEIVITSETKGYHIQLLEVFIYIYVSISINREASIMGDVSQKGVLEIEEDIINSLKNNNLGIDSIFWNYWKRRAPSETVTADFENFVQRKDITFYYKKKVQN
jgi:hypothetical protein